MHTLNRNTLCSLLGPVVMFAGCAGCGDNENSDGGVVFPEGVVISQDGGMASQSLCETFAKCEGGDPTGFWRIVDSCVTPGDDTVFACNGMKESHILSLSGTYKFSAEGKGSADLWVSRVFTRTVPASCIAQDGVDECSQLSDGCMGDIADSCTCERTESLPFEIDNVWKLGEIPGTLVEDPVGPEMPVVSEYCLQGDMLSIGRRVNGGISTVRMVRAVEPE